MTRWEPPKDHQGYNFNAWKCPNCDFEHDKPHFPKPGTIDKTKEPGKRGRIIGGSNTENITDEKCRVPINEDDESEGLYCPVCGWNDDVITIKKETICANDLECALRNCPEPVAFHSKKMNISLCDKHRVEGWRLVPVEAVSGWKKVKAD